MKKLNYKQLGQFIKDVYLDNTRYQVNKNVPEFKKDGKYVGDFFNFTMLELDGDNPPTFYHNYSPYDIISSKTTDYAAVFRGGERILDFEFAPFMLQRTGVMTSLVLGGLGITNLSSKRVLYIGTGRIARCDVEAMKEHYPELRRISFIDKGNNSQEFVDFAAGLGVHADKEDIASIGDFDVIVCHTSSKEAILTAELLNDIKPGAVITTFSSEDFTEVATEYFDTTSADIIIDWDQTVEEAPELKAAVTTGRADRGQITTLKTLFSTGLKADAPKKYTIYRTHGTPMQNLAAMKLVMSQESED